VPLAAPPTRMSALRLEHVCIGTASGQEPTLRPR
jgi:hypothetical protein